MLEQSRLDISYISVMRLLASHTMESAYPQHPDSGICDCHILSISQSLVGHSGSNVILQDGGADEFLALHTLPKSLITQFPEAMFRLEMFGKTPENIL